MLQNGVRGQEQGRELGTVCAGTTAAEAPRLFQHPPKLSRLLQMTLSLDTGSEGNPVVQRSRRQQARSASNPSGATLSSSWHVSNQAFLSFPQGRR